MSAANPSTSLVGIYGGTFNPIHVGHLRAAEEVVEAFDLSRMIFVPSARPPHKAGRGENIAPASDRLRWVRLAIESAPHFEVDTIEVDREGPSYMVDTLSELRERLAPEEPVFTIGHDAFVELATWREPERVLSLAHFVVTSRPPIDSGLLRDWIPAPLRGAVEVLPGGDEARHRITGTWIRRVTLTNFDVSASMIRARIAAGRSVRYLVPESAHDALLESGCYRDAARDRERNREKDQERDQGRDLEKERSQGCR